MNKLLIALLALFLTACSTTNFERDQIASDLVDRWEWQSGEGDSNWYVNDWQSDGTIVGNCRDYAITLRYAVKESTGQVGNRVSVFRLNEHGEHAGHHVYLCFDDGTCYDQNGRYSRAAIDRHWFRVMERQFPYHHNLIVNGNRFEDAPQ